MEYLPTSIEAAKLYGASPAPGETVLRLAARSIAIHNAKFKRYFLRKLEQGKEKRLILNNVANKLLSIISAVIRTGTAYIENYRYQSSAAQNGLTGS